MDAQGGGSSSPASGRFLVTETSGSFSDKAQVLGRGPVRVSPRRQKTSGIWLLLCPKPQGGLTCVAPNLPGWIMTACPDALVGLSECACFLGSSSIGTSLTPGPILEPTGPCRLQLSLAPASPSSARAVAASESSRL